MLRGMQTRLPRRKAVWNHKLEPGCGPSHDAVNDCPYRTCAAYLDGSLSRSHNSLYMWSTAFFIMIFISSSVIREYPALPSHVGHNFPAWMSSMGPFRKARATIALASLAIFGSMELFFNTLSLRGATFV